MPNGHSNDNSNEHKKSYQDENIHKYSSILDIIW